MARGQKLDNETIYKIMASYSTTKSFTETSTKLNIPRTTVEKIYKSNKDKPEFVKLCREIKDNFADMATEIINKGMKLLDRRITTALEHEEELAEMIQEIWSKDKSEMSQDEKTRLVDKIKTLQIQRLQEITTATGTLFDKRALAKGESTERVSIVIETNYE